MTVVFADHPLITAIPFVVPALVLSVGIAVLALRERRRGRRQS